MSLLSFNFALNDDFEGGGTRFNVLNKTVNISQGDVVMHSGKCLHAGRQTTRGIRYIIVGFVQVDSKRVNYPFIEKTSKTGISDDDLFRDILLY